jgi:hypothetical protein
VVWRYDGRALVAFTADDPAADRSKGRSLPGTRPLGELIAWLRAAPDVEAVAAFAFPVRPAAGE